MILSDWKTKAGRWIHTLPSQVFKHRAKSQIVGHWTAHIRFVLHAITFTCKPSVPLRQKDQDRDGGNCWENLEGVWGHGDPRGRVAPVSLARPNSNTSPESKEILEIFCLLALLLSPSLVLPFIFQVRVLSPQRSKTLRVPLQGIRPRTCQICTRPRNHSSHLFFFFPRYFPSEHANFTYFRPRHPLGRVSPLRIDGRNWQGNVTK